MISGTKSPIAVLAEWWSECWWRQLLFKSFFCWMQCSPSPNTWAEGSRYFGTWTRWSDFSPPPFHYHRPAFPQTAWGLPRESLLWIPFPWAEQKVPGKHSISTYQERRRSLALACTSVPKKSKEVSLNVLSLLFICTICYIFRFILNAEWQFIPNLIFFYHTKNVKNNSVNNGNINIFLYLLYLYFSV